MENSCIFCKIIAGQLPSHFIWYDEDVIVIKDIHPKAPIHYLIIPKKHYVDIRSFSSEDAKVAYKVFIEVPKMLAETVDGANDFNLVVNNGAGAGQVIFHMHVHFLAGKKLFNL